MESNAKSQKKTAGKVVFTVLRRTLLSVFTLVMLVLVPEILGGGFLAVLLILANITFLLYDFVIPKMEIILSRVIPGIK